LKSRRKSAAVADFEEHGTRKKGNPGDILAKETSMRRRLIGVTCVLLMSCRAAYADSIVVTGGSLSQTFVGGNTPFVLEGDGLRVAGIGYENFIGPGNCNPCIAGSTFISFDSTLVSFVNQGPVPGSVRGNAFADVFLDGTMLFFGPSFPASQVVSNPTPTLIAPFTFSAVLRGFPTSALTGTPIFDETFVGHGTATASYDLTTGPGATLVTFNDLVYQFEAGAAPSPTPEPGSMLLVLTGLAAVTARFRRTTRRSGRAN
jgi:PEP-CTERM motif-containing protein